MKLNKWTVALAAVGLINFSPAIRAEENNNSLLTAVSSTTLSGYVDASAIWKPGTGDGFMPGRAFDGGAGNPGGNKLDGFNLNVFKLAIEKPIAEDGWHAGYRVDLIFGPDAVGYNTSVNAAAAPGDLSIQQAYVALRMPIGNGIDWKIGTWSTMLGYEVFESGSNPNYGRSYGWQLEPTQHTGVMAAYKVNDVISLTAGIANTLSSGINTRSPRAESHKTYMGSITLASPEKSSFLPGATLTFAAVDGFGGNAGKDTVNLYAGTTIPTPLKALTIGGAFDYRFNGANSITPATPTTENWAMAAALYLNYQATEKLKLNARADYTEGSDGTWYNGGAQTATNAVSPVIPVPVSDKQNELGSLTLTADYSLWANVMSRLELRWDHSFRDKPYNGGSDKNAVTLAANIIYKF